TYAWVALMLALDLAPPTHVDAGGRWRRVWDDRLERLSRNGPYPLAWQDHPGYDEYWRSRSIPVEEIEVPTFVIGGWRDIYPEAMTQVYARLACEKRLLMGPWVHVQPDLSPVEPVDWLHELRRWWDRCVKDEDDARAPEPRVTLFV